MSEQELMNEGARIADLFADDNSIRIQALIIKYGREEMTQYTLDFSEHLTRLSESNKDLAIDEGNASEEEYNRLVGRIMDATKSYYQFVGHLPEDVRRFFLSLFDSTNPDSEPLDDLSRLLDVAVPPIRQMLPSIQAIRPKKYIMQIDAITGQLPALTDNNQLKVGTRGNQPIKTTVTLDIPDHMRIEGGTVLSTYDKSIINGVTSLLESGNSVFSIPMLYHAMTGKQNPTVDEQLFEEINGKLEKMRRLMINIDLTEENKAQFIPGADGEMIEISDMKIEGYLLPLNKVTAVVNGKKTEVFQLLSNPPLYTYSKLKRQLASVPISLLSAPINNNATTIPLKTYLLQRIELMKNKNNSIKSNTILYSSIYSELGDAKANKTRKMRIRTYTTTILEYFKELEYISGYSEYKSGRSIAGVKIEL